MADEFQFDVFLSHSAKDKAVVRELAERLKKDGVRVWLDEEQIKPGDSIPAKMEAGLEHSRVLVLCMSANAFGSDWAQLEAGTFRFRDPLNKERRFIPLRLDDAPIKGSLAQFLYIDWRPTQGFEEQYRKLHNACLISPKSKTDEAQIIARRVLEKTVHLSYKSEFTAYAFAPNGEQCLACSNDGALRLWDLKSARSIKRLVGNMSSVRYIEWSADQRRILISSDYDNARLLDIESGRVLADYGKADLSRRQMECFRLVGAGMPANVMEGLLGVHHLTLWNHLKELRNKLGLRTMDELRRLAGRFYKGTPQRPRLLQTGHMWLRAIAWITERDRALSGEHDDDLTFRLCSGVDDEHYGKKEDITPSPWKMAWQSDQGQVIYGHEDGALRIWDFEMGHPLHVLEGHTSAIESLAWHKNNRLILSASRDQTVRVWDIQRKLCISVLSGHARPIIKVVWSEDGLRAFSGDIGGDVRIWDLSEFVNAISEGKDPSIYQVTSDETPIEELLKLRLPEHLAVRQQVQYTNAKVLLVGESGVGKTGLSNYLAHGVKVEDNKPLPSTDGAWATHWPLRHEKKKAGVEREIWLWDFAGQVDYRLVHQLFMDDTAAAVLAFNPQNENPFEGLGHWDRDLQKAARKPFAKLLAAARIDRGGLVVSAASIKKFMKERGFFGPLHLTSAKTGEGCDQLREAIVHAIDWKSIPETTSPALYRRLKQEILNLRDSGLVLIRLAELKQRMEMALRGENFEMAELEAVVSLLAGPGMIQRLDFGGFILLRPEVLSRYAAAVVRKVRKHPQELGCIREDELLAGDLDYQDFKRLPREDEAVVLRTLLESFISRAWCLRQPCDGSAMLTFPSYFRRERKEQPSHPSVLVTYRFDGPADDIYATLVVRLHHTVAFNSTDLWKSAADFKTQTGQKLGFTLTRESEGTSLLEVYFEPDVDGNSRVLFLRYVHEHLMQHAMNVIRLRRYFCGNRKCDSHGKQFANQLMIDKALAPGGKGKVFCPDCGKPILLRDAIEEKFESPAVKEQARELEAGVQVVLDNESRELILVGHTFSIVAEAGQIYRGFTNSDHGIDGEIEFKDNEGRASGKRLYVQLKSGDSYLRKRKSDGAEVFQIKNQRWVEYWKQQAYPVMLIVRTSDAQIRWMDISAYLKNRDAQPEKVQQILFTGERFDAVSVSQLRARILGGQAV